MKVAIYIRVSTEDQVRDGYSPQFFALTLDD